MYYFKIRNFERFQHYKDRNPPWIKLYYQILHDRRFYCLDDASKWLTVGCFLLASQCENKIPFDADWIAKELCLSTAPNWQVLLESEFIQPIDCDASTLLASCSQDASQRREEKRRDREETEAEILSVSQKTRKPSVCETIFHCWNSQTATMHHRRINGQEKAIVQTLRKYSPEEICRAIERYNAIRADRSGKYRQVYAWTLGEFLTRHNSYNIERFNSESWEEPFLETGTKTGIGPANYETRVQDKVKRAEEILREKQRAREGPKHEPDSVAAKSG